MARAMRWRNILLAVPLILWSCIDPFRIEDLPENRLLTVDGFISTEPGPHTIRLTFSDRYGSVFDGVVVPAARADVAIRDENGINTFLEESIRGTYQTPADFSAEIGKTYTLYIELTDGRRYSSLPVTVVPVPEIESVSIRTRVIPTQNRFEDRSGAELIVNFTDPAEQRNFYHWRLENNYYVYLTRPDLFTLPPNHPTNPRGAAPKDCCELCFRSEPNRLRTFEATNDRDFNGLSTSRAIAFIEDNGFRFMATYRTDVLQMSIPESAFNFFRLMRQQQDIDGSVFDPPPAFIRSNIINESDVDERVLGFFFAADVSRKTVYIPREALEVTQAVNVVPDDCRETPGATQQEPPGWNPSN